MEGFVTYLEDTRTWQEVLSENELLALTLKLPPTTLGSRPWCKAFSTRGCSTNGGIAISRRLGSQITEYCMRIDTEADPDDPPYWIQVRAKDAKAAVAAARVQMAQDYCDAFGAGFEPDAATFPLVLVVDGKPGFAFEVGETEEGKDV